MEPNHEPTLLEKTKNAVSEVVSLVSHTGLAETITTTAQHAIEKIEHIAKAFVAPEHTAVPPEDLGIAPKHKADAKANGGPQHLVASQPVMGRRGVSNKPHPVHASSHAPAVFKVKRGQKH